MEQKSRTLVIGFLHSIWRFWGLHMLLHLSVVHYWMVCHHMDVPHFVYLFIWWWTFELFPVWGHYGKSCYVHSCYKFLCEQVFSFLLGRCLGMEWLGPVEHSVPLGTLWTKETGSQIHFLGGKEAVKHVNKWISSESDKWYKDDKRVAESD